MGCSLIVYFYFYITSFLIYVFTFWDYHINKLFLFIATKNFVNSTNHFKCFIYVCVHIYMAQYR